MRFLSVAILTSACLLVGCSHLKALHGSKASNTNTESTNSSGSLPSGRGTPDEAKAMLAQAVEHYNKVGRVQALSDFTKMKSPFGDRDLYVSMSSALDLTTRFQPTVALLNTSE
jgi:hypothetical protein